MPFKKLIIAFFLLPSLVSAITTVPWVADSASSGFIYPLKVNGTNQGILVNGSTTISLPVNQIFRVYGAATEGLIYAQTGSASHFGQLRATNGSGVLTMTQYGTNYGGTYAGTSFNDLSVIESTGTNMMFSYDLGSAIFVNGNKETMRLTNGGNLGIGTSTPNYALSVSGSGFLDGGTLTASSLVATSTLVAASTTVPGAFLAGDATSTNLYVSRLASTSALRANTALFGGNVGIGNTNPTGILHITSGSTQHTEIKIENTGNLDTKFTFIKPQQWNLGVDNDDYTFQVNTGSNVGAGFFVLHPNRKAAFGTTSPAHLLTLSSSTIPQLTLTDGVTGSTPFAFRQIGSTLYIATSSQASLATSTNTFFTLDGSTGKVGIGTSTPEQSFVIEGGNPYIQLYDNSGTASTGFVGYNGARLQLWGGPSVEAISLLPSGNVGIGHTAPPVNLDVIGTIRAARSTADTTYLEMFGGSGAADPYLNWIGAGTNFTLRFNGSPLMMVQNGGNVGIATTTPDKVLSVYGGISFGNLPAAGATRDSLCIGVTDNYVYRNAASSCLVSLAETKLDIATSSATTTLSNIMKLRPTIFTSKASGRPSAGFVAEELEQVDPRYTTYDRDGNLASYEPSTILSDAVKVIQEQQKKIEQLEARIEALEMNK